MAVEPIDVAIGELADVGLDLDEWEPERRRCVTHNARAPGTPRVVAQRDVESVHVHERDAFVPMRDGAGERVEPAAEEAASVPRGSGSVAAQDRVATSTGTRRNTGSETTQELALAGPGLEHVLDRVHRGARGGR